MMKSHHSSKLRTFGGGATVLALAGVSLTLGAPGLAHPEPEGKGKESQRIIIMEHKSEEGAGAEQHTRSFTLRRDENGEVVVPEGCEQGEQIADVDERSGDQRTRLILCSRGDGTPAERVERLQRARERLAEDSHLSAEQRTRITAALDREIARLRAE